MKSLHTDGGSEFAIARKLFEELGVHVSTSTPYTPASNGLVERMQGVILAAARSCLIEAKLSPMYWKHALEHVVDAKNAVPHSTTGKIPHEELFGSYPEYVRHMIPFGCRILVSPIAKKFKKFAPRLIEGINLGHVGGGVYKVLTKDRILITKHVRVFEEEFPGDASTNQDDIQGSLGNRIDDTVSDGSVGGYASDSEKNLISRLDSPQFTKKIWMTQSGLNLNT